MINFQLNIVSHDGHELICFIQNLFTIFKLLPMANKISAMAKTG